MPSLEEKVQKYIKDNPDVLFDNYLKKQLKDKEFKRMFEESQLETKIMIELMRLRKRKNMTQTQLAKIVKMPQANIARIERGEHLPTLTTLARIFNALGERICLQIGERSISL